MSVTDAHWLFEWARSEYDWSNGDYVGPAVYVYSAANTTKPACYCANTASATSI